MRRQRFSSAAMAAASLAAVALARAASAQATTATPVVGILTLPNALPAPLANFTSQFPASYASWVGSGGARVVPLLYDAPAEATRALLAQLNGAVLTGGGTAFFEADGVTLTQYAATAQLILDESLAAAARGEWWPVWGTCLGHELLLVLAAGPNRTVLGSGFDSEDVQLALAPTAEAPASRLWGAVAAEEPAAWAWLTTENITENLHVQGVEPAAFAGSAALAAGYRVLTTNVDRKGRPFVSSFEGKAAPVYGSQFHSEKPAWEWTQDYAIPHSYHAVVANNALARFFVNETRRNARAFASRAAMLAALIGNTPPFFTAALEDATLRKWEAVYVFGPWTAPGGGGGGAKSAATPDANVIGAAAGGALALCAAAAAGAAWCRGAAADAKGRREGARRLLE
jgi:gamma-glutamyl hydrolase